MQKEIVVRAIEKSDLDPKHFLKASAGIVGDKRFLVNSIWWRKWCDFVNFDLTTNTTPVETTS